MPQIFYIESDEEIISVIRRLHKADSKEILFVFPKRALVLQSIINLRLLAREAEKFDKEIVIVSQDEVGRALAEKAGIPTENYSEDIMKRATHLELSEKDLEMPMQIMPQEDVAVEEDMLTPSSVTLGTNDFFGTQRNIDSFNKQHIAYTSEKKSEPIPLRIRNASPEKLTMLNSMRQDTQKPVLEKHSKVSLPLKETSSLEPIYTSLHQEPVHSTDTTPMTNERLKNFYSQKSDTSSYISSRQKMPQKNTPKEDVAVDKRAKIVFFVLGFISFLSLSSVGVLFFFSKVEITLTPYRTTQTVDKEFQGMIDTQNASENILSTRIIEAEKEVSVSVSATGKSEGSGQKAHGKIQIMNSYSTEDQPLIATTRLETTDGKLFRLEENIVVPGMKVIDGKNEPGVIEASIIADQVGESYNTKELVVFSIPGFKGGEKYAKFTAKATQAITGGGTGTLSDVNVIAKVDIDTAIKNAEDKAKDLFLSDMRNDMLKNEAVIDDQIEITPLDKPVLPEIGSVSNTFEYTGIFKMRALVFDEQKIKESIISENEKPLFRITSILPSYDHSIVDFSSNTFRIKVHSIIDTETNIDQQKIKKAVLGQKSSYIENLTKDFPEVYKVQFRFSFGGLIDVIPKNENRVSILIAPKEP